MQTTNDNSANWTCRLTPEPPDWSINWEHRFTHLDWVKPMIDCRQDPLHHAEGDVATHVRMVCQALTHDSEWQSLPKEARDIIFLAAAMHDVAKPACTVIDEQGRISSPDHGKRGAQMVRKILWRDKQFIDNPPALAIREQISALVRYSSLPFWFWDKEEPLRSIIRTSQSVRLDWLAQLSAADAKGRICQDLNSLLSRVQMFRDYALEHKCLAQPYTFSSPVSRFHYFHHRTNSGDNAAVPRDVWDETKFEVTLMCGLPGAGKDHWIAQHEEGTPVISLDAIRARLGVDFDDDQGKVIACAREEAKALMRKEQSFIWNATNVTRFLRDPLVRFFHDYGARIRIAYIEPPSFRHLLHQNAQRKNPLPERVIDLLADKLEVPDLTEAHEVLWSST